MWRSLTAGVVLPVTLLTGPAGAADNVTCRASVHAANVVPNRHVPGVVTTYGTDVAMATATCVSATGQQFDAWVYVAIFDSDNNVLAAAESTPSQAKGGTAVAMVTSIAAGYDEQTETTPRVHAAWAWAHTSDCSWPCVKTTVSVSYPA